MVSNSIKTKLPALGLAVLPFASSMAGAKTGSTTGTAASTVAETAAGKPNVVLILTDDQGWGDVRAHGNPRIDTPNMDRLYNESVVMDQFYVCPLSAPTRASLLTGRYHLRTGVSSVQSGLENMNPEETTLAELFRAAGYTTGCFGKWHNGTYYPYTPLGQGFDTFLGFCCGHWPTYFDPPLQRGEEMFRGKGYITDIFTDAALEFIDRNHKKPFFCYVPYNAPHSPFQVPDKYYDKYKDIEAANERDQRTLASIYAMVECVDDNIGRLLERLNKLGIRENTIVIFMTDNGPVHVVRYNGGMRGTKGTVHEGGVRVPCYINWQGTLKHSIVEGVAAHIDMLPTIMELCGITDYKTAFPVDGVSFAAHVRQGSDIPAGRTIYTHRLDKKLTPWMGAARTGDWRLTVYPGNKPSLYDIARDYAETTDIYNASNPKHKALFDSYQSWFADASRGVALNTNVPVGYKKAPQVRIPTPEGKMYGQLKCYGYPNQNWVRHFQTRADSLVYTLDVVRNGTYEIVLEFNHNGKDPESTAYAAIGGKTLKKQVPEFVSRIFPSHNREETGEAPEKSWGRFSLGTVKLGKGLHPLTVWAEGVRDKETMEAKTVIINRK